MQNTKKHTEKPLTKYPTYQYFLTKTIVEIHEITNGKSVKIVLVPAKVTLGY